MNIYIAITALSISIISFILTIWFNRRQLGVQSLTSLSHMINLERGISNIPSAFRFHGITEKQIINAGITPEELSYLVSSITAGGVYHRTHSPSCSKPFPADSYRYNMCKTEEFRVAWPLVKHMMNESSYVKKIDETIKIIEIAIMTNVNNLTEAQLSQALTYAGFILVAYELVKGMIVNPIKLFYTDVTFHEGSPFSSYDEDVASRHKNKFEASLLFLRDFMEVIDSEDMITIQTLRKHRNDLAHELPAMLNNLNIDDYLPLLEKTDKALFKLSNHNTYMEIGVDPEFKNKSINWDTLKGPEYVLFEEIISKVKILGDNIK